MTNQVTIEIQTAPGVWTPVKFYDRDAVTITRGRSDMQSQATAQVLTFTLDNRDGQYSPRNPMSPLYGKIGRNTRVRCTMDNGSFFRFYGDIPGIAPVWNENHADNFIQVEAYGILRRLGQGQPVVSNALRDFTLGQSPTFLASLAAYYPLSGGEGTIYSQNIAPGMVGSFRGILNPVFTYGKDMPSWIGTGMELNATGDNPYMEGTAGKLGSSVALDFVWNTPALGVLTPQFTDYNSRTWGVFMNTSTNGGTLFVGVTNADGTSTSFPVTAQIPALLDTELHHFRLQVDSTGIGNVDATHTVYIDGVAVTTGTLANSAPNGARHTRFHYSRFVGQTVMNMAHVTVWVGASSLVIPAIADAASASLGYVGEDGLDRITRVATNGGIPLILSGASAGPMGAQFPETRLEQIRDVESTNMGLLFEARDDVGLTYFALSQLYNQTPWFTLDYSAGQVVAPLEPVDDDQVTRNDVTATRRDGGSRRVTVDTGALSTQDPPNGVGRYATEVTVNPQTDELLDPIAGWIVGIGTLDKARWPSVTVNLNSPNIPAALVTLLKQTEIGDKFVIKNMRQAFVYDDVSLIIVGYTETITSFTHVITFNCMPADPYEVFVVEDNGSRISSGDTSQVNASMTTTATSMSVLSADAVTLWTTAGGDLPMSLMVAGEEMTVTAISGTTPGVAQTFTVTRSVNGVVKTHSAGEVVRLKRDAGLAL